MVTVSYAKLSKLQLEVEYVTAEYLKSRGWVATSRNPAHYVLWQRTSHNATLAVPKEMAVTIQRQLDDGMPIMPGQNWPEAKP